MRLFPILAFLSIAALVSCKKENKMSKIPSIRFLSATPATIVQGKAGDTSFIAFYFEDGDGNINTMGTAANISLQDMRFPSQPPLKFGFPPIPDGFKDPAYGFKGTCIVGIPAVILQFRDTLHTRDTIQYELSIIDDANNVSNKVMTTPIYITE